jgi:uncharacterized protein
MTITMRGALDHPLVVKVINYQAAMAQQNFAEGAKVFAPDVLYNVPGNNPLSGTFVGPEAVMGYFGNLMGITAGTYEILDMLWLVSGERVALSTSNKATIKGETLIWDEVIVFEFVDGLKQRIDQFQSEGARVDAFFNSAA